MHATTHMSEKGQVVIPKATRDRMRLAKGECFEVIERPDGVLLRKQTPKSGETFEEITARIRARVNYTGPVVTIEEMHDSIAKMWAQGGSRWDK